MFPIDLCDCHPPGSQAAVFMRVLFLFRLSPSGSVLLGVGSDRQGRCSVVMWNTSAIFMSGEVQVAAQAHTDVSIRRMQLSSDCSR